MRKALILGARGNLGQQLTAVFNPDYETISWDRGEIDIADRDLIIKKTTPEFLKKPWNIF